MFKINNLKREWCPGADLNHRHPHFQCDALPTELPGHRVAAGCERSACIEYRKGPVQHQSYGVFGWPEPAIGQQLRGLEVFIFLVAGIDRTVRRRFVSGHAIIPVEPFRQVQIGAAFRAERAHFYVGGFAADRALSAHQGHHICVFIR